MPTKIEWCQESWNPVTGCSPVSEGCQNCYARRMAQRLKGRYGYPADDPFRVTFHPDRLDQPLKWKKPRLIFVCSMGDLFHSKVKSQWLAHIWSTIHRCPQHFFLLLTKRPERMVNWINTISWYDTETAKNVGLGVTAENQKRADERIPILLQIPAAVRFVSLEPMLGPVDLKPYFFDWNAGLHIKKMDSLIWVICGGETGPGARAMHPDWPRLIRNQCQKARVPFFFKSWGRHVPAESGSVYALLDYGEPQFYVKRDKTNNHRLLDGRTWDEYPQNQKRTKSSKNRK